MECKSIKISDYSLKEIRKIAKEVGEPTDDTAVRHILADREKMKLEIELLNKRIQELEQQLEKIRGKRK